MTTADLTGCARLDFPIPRDHAATYFGLVGSPKESVRQNRFSTFAVPDKAKYLAETPAEQLTRARRIGFLHSDGDRCTFSGLFAKEGKFQSERSGTVVRWKFDRTYSDENPCLKTIMMIVDGQSQRLSIGRRGFRCAVGHRTAKRG